MADIFLIGNGAGFSGDRIDAPGPVVDTLIARGLPSALFMEVLGERTIALAQLERRRDPDRGYEPMLERLLEPILRKCVAAGIPIIGNFGAANPAAAGRCVAALATRLGLPDLRIAIVEGDDIRATVDLDALEVYEADEQLPARKEALIAANVYLGAQAIADALKQGADIVIAGRVADPALALGPLIHHFGWSEQDLDLLAVGATAGHLLECGSQVSGGVFYDPGFKDVPSPENLGFPIAEVTHDGGLLITKADNTGGLVDLRTVKEQLLYEIHDPSAYVTPDVVIDMTAVTLEQEGVNRVRVHGVRGRAAPEKLKVTASFEGGYLGEGEFSLAGVNCFARARLARTVLLDRLAMRKLDVRARVDLIGVSSVHDDDNGTGVNIFEGPEPRDIRVRLAVVGPMLDDVDQAVREVLAMLCCGPAGSGGARWRTTPRIHTRSYLVPREAVPVHIRSYLATELG